MTRVHSPAYRIFFALTIALGTARADYKADIGWTKLQAELGGSLPTGTGVSVSQIEAPEAAGSPTPFRPDSASAEFAGKTFTFKSAGTTSGHATTVAGYYYGLTGSIAPGISTIDVYEAGNWLQSGFLRYGSNLAPNAEPRAIQSHSWIHSFDNGGPGDVDALRRFDYAIQTSGFLATVGLNNFDAGNVPEIFGASYNAISVGRSDGFHSYGTNTADGAGRTKPELVAPQTATSWSTPTVAATAAMLRQNAPTIGRKVVALKSILLAGATKTQFPGWSRTTTRPIDSIYGAGQVNAYRSQRILAEGQQPSSANTTLKVRGWDVNTTTAATRLYFFDIAPGNTASAFSAALTWNRTITNGATAPLWATPSASLADLSLTLYNAIGSTIFTVVDSSESTVDNVEHIYQPALPPGRYALRVTSPQNSVEYGLAWYSQPTITIAATTPTAAEHGLEAGAFTFTRSGDTTAALTVAYTISGNATAGSDFAALSGTATFSANSATTVVTLTPLADSLAEGTETATLTLTPDINYSVGPAASATVTIADLPIDAWRFDKFTTAELADPQLSGDTADFENDGTFNLLEYALALDPKASTPGLPFPTRSAGILRLTYTKVKAATDITYTVQVGNEVGTWNSGPTFTQTVSTIDNGTTETITAESLLPLDTGQKQFIRLRITRP